MIQNETYTHTWVENIVSANKDIQDSLILKWCLYVSFLRGLFLYMSLNLVNDDQAWELWNLGKELDLVDNSIRGSASKEEALRCIQVGLLCTQVECGDRPTMPTVLKILKGEESLLNLHDKIARAPPILDFQYYSHSGNTSYSISSMNREVLGADELSLDLREIYGMPGIDTSGDSSAMATNNVESTTDKEKVLTNIMTSKSKSKRGIREVIASMMARMGGSSRGSRKNLRIAF